MKGFKSYEASNSEEGAQCVVRKPALWGSEEDFAENYLNTDTTVGPDVNNDSKSKEDSDIQDSNDDDDANEDFLAEAELYNNNENPLVNDDSASNNDDEDDDYDDMTDSALPMVCHWYDSKALREQTSSSKLQKNSQKQRSFGEIYQSIINVPNSFTVDYVAVLVNATVPR